MMPILIYQEVRDGGEHGFGVFLAEKLPELLETSVEAVKGVAPAPRMAGDAGSDGSNGKE